MKLFQKVVSWFEAFVPIRAPELSETELTVQRLQCSAAMVKSSVYRSTIEIDSVMPNVLLYTTLIERAIRSLDREYLFRRSYDPPIVEARIPIAQFYRQLNGDVLAVDRTHRDFSQMAQDLLILYEQLSSLPEVERHGDQGLLSTNMERIRPVVENIHVLARQLITLGD